MAQEEKNMLSIQIKDGVSKKTGNSYVYVALFINNTELTRMFIKPTELEYYQQLEGDYILQPQD